MSKIRVVVLGTGNVSSYAIGAFARRKGFELVGVWAHPETAGADIGKDAGEIRFAGGMKTGVTVTGDMDELIALKPDCAFIGVNGPNLEEIAVPIAEKFLLAGINVVGTSLTSMIHPSTYHTPALTERLDKACKEGNATFFMSGIHPGFSCDYLVSTLLSVADRVDSVRAIEICDYSMAPNEFEMKTGRGFGMPTDFVAVCENPAFMQATWGPCVDLIADSLGYQVESYKTNYEKALTDHDLQVGYGTIKAGTVGAVRLSITGVISGKDAITVGAVNRMGADVAPEWEFAPGMVYRITIKGAPNLNCDFSANDQAWGYSMVCMRALNAIPQVVKEEPGLLSSLDLYTTATTEAFE
ncbi:MAG: hypothetical protein LUE87_05360 [Lachnospiraceae bacterium]|nr:hypothetical protein [Lachnospiraceae bacterium]